MTGALKAHLGDRLIGAAKCDSEALLQADRHPEPGVRNPRLIAKVR
ncbi:hypothetical protein [Anabaenopsis elenkinii]|uniref:Uncharacterized protein n=1 Tax=Anabaenopsis elenkinii CCIBt3563 TaxID=2779889 RepID=A0A7S6RCI6_9CYAN|nr:hypothetical protein [Anabaenopsis elenkinii]QOV22433.1 hypothetical protein IM676_17460 [Anabaenopsis elenkinii CCIBt3563]